MMDPVILDKIVAMLSKRGVTTDTMDKLKSELSQPKEVSVTKVEMSDNKEPEEDTKYDIEKITDEEIDKMSEQEAKDYIKKARDAEVSADKTESSCDMNPNKSSIVDTFNKMQKPSPFTYEKK